MREFESKSSDGLVSVVVTGQREVKTLSIDLSLSVDKKELERLLTSVLNGALAMVREANIKLSEDVTKSYYKEIGFDAGGAQ